MTNKLRPHTLMVLAFLSSTKAERNFDLILTDSTCTVNSDYIRHDSCIVNKSQPTNARLSLCGTLVKEIRNLRIDISVILIRRIGKPVTLFKAYNIDGCALFYTNTTLPILKMYRDVLVKYSNWAMHCPFPVGYEYKIVDITLDTKYLPQFVPEANFKINVIHYEQYKRRVQFWNLGIYGKISRKRKYKGNRIK